MAAKPKLTKVIRITQEGGAASVPKVGQALGPHGVNIGAVIKDFNARTQEYSGLSVPADLSVYEDRSFELEIRSPATSSLLKKAAGIKKGSGTPHSQSVGTITVSQLEEIAKMKMRDLNTGDLEAAKGTVMGTARSMGIKLVD